MTHSPPLLSNGEHYRWSGRSSRRLFPLRSAFCNTMRMLMYPVAVPSFLPPSRTFLLCLHFSVLRMGSSVHTNKSSSYLPSTGWNSEIGGGGEGGGEDDFSIRAHVGVRKTPYTPLRFPFRVIPSLQFEGYLNQPVAEKKGKPKPSYNLSARSCHLTTAVFSLSTPTSIFASFHPSAFGKFHYWFRLVVFVLFAFLLFVLSRMRWLMPLKV